MSIALTLAFGQRADQRIASYIETGYCGLRDSRSKWTADVADLRSKREPQADAKKCAAAANKKHLLAVGTQSTSWLLPCSAAVPAAANRLLALARGMTTKTN